MPFYHRPTATPLARRLPEAELINAQAEDSSFAAELQVMKQNVLDAPPAAQETAELVQAKQYSEAEQLQGDRTTARANLDAEEPWECKAFAEELKGSPQRETSAQLQSSPMAPAIIGHTDAETDEVANKKQTETDKPASLAPIAKTEMAISLLAATSENHAADVLPILPLMSEDVCFVCLEAGSLIRPCKCSIHAHRFCMTEWMQKQQCMTVYKCSVCKNELDVSITQRRVGVACDTKMLSITAMLLCFCGAATAVLNSANAKIRYASILSFIALAHCAMCLLYRRATGSYVWWSIRSPVATSSICLENGHTLSVYRSVKWLTVSWDEVLLFCK